MKTKKDGRQIGIYVAGAITPKGDGNHAIEYLENVRRGIKEAVQVLLKGYAPLCPFTDGPYWIVLNEWEHITEDMIKGASMGMLEKADAVLVLPKAEKSTGTRDEIKRAERLGIPIFYSLEYLDAHFMVLIEEGRI